MGGVRRTSNQSETMRFSAARTAGPSSEITTSSMCQGAIWFRITAIPVPEQAYFKQYGYPYCTYYKTTPGQRQSAIYPAGLSAVIPVEMEVFKVIRGKNKAVTKWIPEPLEPDGDNLSNALAQSVLLSIENQDAALAEVLMNLKKAQVAFVDELDFLKPLIDKEEDIVRLNVLGSLVDVSRSVLRLHEESMLATIFDSSKWRSHPHNMDEGGRYRMVSGDILVRDLNIYQAHVFMHTCPRRSLLMPFGS